MNSILSLTRPLRIFLGSMTYLLGAGIASYLGIAFTQDGFWLGLGWIILILICANLLAEVFRPVTEPVVENDTLGYRIRFRNMLLLVAGAALTSAVGLTILIVRLEQVTVITLIYLSIFLFLSLAYAVPPMRLIATGFGEFILSILLANLPASLAFLLQAGEYHRLVGFVTFPLILLCLAWLIVLDFPSYTRDQKYQHVTILRLISWERAVPLHHILILIAYITFLMAPVIGISLTLIWPAFLTLPFALLQILLVRGLALGGRPNWRLLMVTATAVFGLTLYFITLTFWIR